MIFLCLWFPEFTQNVRKIWAKWDLASHEDPHRDTQNHQHSNSSEEGGDHMLIMWKRSINRLTIPNIRFSNEYWKFQYLTDLVFRSIGILIQESIFFRTCNFHKMLDNIDIYLSTNNQKKSESQFWESNQRADSFYNLWSFPKILKKTSFIRKTIWIHHFYPLTLP